MTTVLEAYEEITTTRLFCVGYTWVDKHLGELKASTVVDACDEETALRSFRSKHRHVIEAHIIH